MASVLVDCVDSACTCMEIGAGTQQFRHVIEWNEESLPQRRPRRIPALGSGPFAVALRQREGDHLLDHGSRTCQTQRQAAADRLQRVEQESTVARTCGKPHLAKCGVEQAHHFFQASGRRNQLQEAEIVALGNTVDQVSLIYARQIARRVEILDTCIAVGGNHPVAAPVEIAEYLGQLW